MHSLTAETFVPTVDNVLDRARHRQGLLSDYKLALVLGVQQSAVSNWRKGRSVPDDTLAARLADLAGLDKGFVVAGFHAMRAEPGSDSQALWHQIVSRLRTSGTALGFAVVAGSALMGSPEPAYSAGLYIMSTRIWGLFQRLTPGRTSPAGHALLVTL